MVIDEYINNQRIAYVLPYPPEMKKGARFNSNSTVKNRLRMMFFEDNFTGGKVIRLPKIEQVPDEWVKKNINECFRSLCEADWHFTNREKWI
jgi:hypothetical protein